MAEPSWQVLGGTPTEDHLARWGLLVKREDLSSPPPGPPFSKMRGVVAHLAKRQERVIGVLDTYHSQAGWAVAQACALLGKQCVNFYPEYRHEPGWRAPQGRARDLGADLYPLPAGRSAVLYHQARRLLPGLANGRDSYMMPNALKLPESVEETAREVREHMRAADIPPLVIVPCSSGTIAAGVARGLQDIGWRGQLALHMGYSRSEEQLFNYVCEQSGVDLAGTPPDKGIWGFLVDEGYAYKDVARGVYDLPFPASPYYDLKAIHWWVAEGRAQFGLALLWLIG